MLEATLLVAAVLCYAILGAVTGPGRPRKLGPADPKTQHTLNFTSAGLRLAPRKKGEIGLCGH